MFKTTQMQMFVSRLMMPAVSCINANHPYASYAKINHGMLKLTLPMLLLDIGCNASYIDGTYSVSVKSLYIMS